MIGAIVLAVLITGACELMWARVPTLHPHRWHFRAMLALFWAAILGLLLLDRLNLTPALFHRGVPRFASDALTYQRQAEVVAADLRRGSFAALVDHQVFNYSRMLGLLCLIFGSNPLIGSVFNAGFYVVSLVSVFLVGSRLFSERPGLIAAWLFAVSPTFLLHDTQTLRWVTTTTGLS